MWGVERFLIKYVMWMMNDEVFFIFPIKIKILVDKSRYWPRGRSHSQGRRWSWPGAGWCWGGGGSGRTWPVEGWSSGGRRPSHWVRPSLTSSPVTKPIRVRTSALPTVSLEYLYSSACIRCNGGLRIGDTNKFPRVSHNNLTVTSDRSVKKNLPKELLSNREWWVVR